MKPSTDAFTFIKVVSLTYQTGQSLHEALLWRVRCFPRNTICHQHIMPSLPQHPVLGIPSLFLITIVSGSRAIAKSKGDKGHPCLTLRFSLISLILSECCPPTSITAHCSLYNIWSQLWKTPPRPNLFATQCRHCHFVLSNAFSASRNKRTLGVFSNCALFTIFIVFLILFFK